MKELVRLNSLLRHVIDVYLRVANVDSGPPLGTVLGNLGVNAVKFVKEYNDFTKNLPQYFTIRVRIFIYENRTTSYSVFPPSTSFLLSALRFPKTFKIRHFDRMRDKTVMCISLDDALAISKYKFANLNLKTSFLIIYGSITSGGLILFVK